MIVWTVVGVAALVFATGNGGCGGILMDGVSPPECHETGILAALTVFVRSSWPVSAILLAGYAAITVWALRSRRDGRG